MFLAVGGGGTHCLVRLSDGAPDAKYCPAIVLIDEIGLHLYPRWQRSILPWLMSAFPNCQIAATTHSPQVIGEIEASHIRAFQYESSGDQIGTIDASQGRDGNFFCF